MPREQLFFTSKVPPNAISYEGAKAAIRQSLEEVRDLEYIDLLLLHAPYGGRYNRLGAWKALVEAVEVGKVRSIGVSNYGVQVDPEFLYDNYFSIFTNDLKASR